MDRLLPAFAVELRARLLAEARDAVLLKVSDKLWDWASQAPTQVSSWPLGLRAQAPSIPAWC